MSSESFKRSIIIMTFLLAASPSALAEEFEEMKVGDLRRKYIANLAAHHYTLMLSAEKALKTQQVQTIVIAVMVGVMVLSGLLLSYAQFRRDDDAGQRSVTTVMIGSGSLKITSSVIGLIILAISFWFFQAYVNKVYALERIDVPAISSSLFVNQAYGANSDGEDDGNEVRECLTEDGEITPCE